MDFATRLLQWRERPPEQWARAANRYLPPAVSAVLIVALAHELGQLTWTLVPGEPLDTRLPVVTTPGPASAGSPGSAELDMTSVIDKHLFGEASAQPLPVVEDVVDAPDTTLSLQLRGVVASENAKNGWAIVADGRAQEKTYFVDDAIDGAGGTRLHAVYGDRILLNRGGRLETLRLPRELPANSVTTRATTPGPAVAPNSLRDVISENASRITDVIRVAPHIEQGQMLGFRINPGRQREQFEALGLQPGDVVTDINGTPMTDPSRGLQVFEALGESTMANVTVVRNGTPEVLVIDTSQLEDLAEGRQ